MCFNFKAQYTGRYSNLTQSTLFVVQKMLEEILEFIGLPWEDAVTNHHTKVNTEVR